MKGSIMQFFSHEEVCRATGLKFHQLEYLQRVGAVEVRRFGRGRDRQYPETVIPQIRRLVALRDELKNVRG